MKEVLITIGEGERWWCGSVDIGERMPFTRETEISLDIRHNPSFNQCNPMIISDGGRYVWCDEYYAMTISGGVMRVESEGEIILKEGFSGIREAYLDCCKNHFPFSGEIPFEDAFTKPQYCTWIAFMYNHTQEGVLDYARTIVREGFPYSQLLIDAGWQEDYGTLEFNPRAFPDPAAMMKELNGLGFKTSLWITPYISPDSQVFRDAEKAGYLIKKPNGESFISHWWDGYSAVIDFSNPDAVEWFNGRLKELADRYGLYGYKWDAGDARLYDDDIVCRKPTTPNGQSELYAAACVGLPVNEIRACCKCAGLPIIQRIADREHSWSATSGIAGLVPRALLQGISGYPYLCPDMIGGGQFADFIDKEPEDFDKELFIRYCQCAALMPIMQFSYPVWRLGEQVKDICKKCCDIHLEYADYILSLARNAAVSGEPIIRGMDYQFGIRGVTDQFMLGDRVLVAPVVIKGEREKKVVLPEGKWKYIPTNEIFEGGREVTVPAPLETLPYFVRSEIE